MASDYSSPENRKLAAVIRELGELLHRDPSINWATDRQWIGSVLRRFGASHSPSRALSERLSGVRFEVGGSEHLLVEMRDDPNRIYKITFGDNLGCRSDFYRSDPEGLLRHFVATGNANPLYYLNRWRLLNSISQYQTRFEGIVPPLDDRHLPCICISQPFVEGSNPDETNIADALSNFGFQKIAMDGFLHQQTHILLADAAPRNVRVADGIPVLFDAIAEVAAVPVREWVKESIK